MVAGSDEGLLSRGVSRWKLRGTVLPRLMNPRALPCLLEPLIAALSPLVVKQSLTWLLSLIPRVIWSSDLVNPQPGKAPGGGDSAGCSCRDAWGSCRGGGHCHPQPRGAHCSPDSGQARPSRAQSAEAEAGKETCSQLALASGSSWSWAPAGLAGGA